MTEGEGGMQPTPAQEVDDRRAVIIDRLRSKAESYMMAFKNNQQKDMFESAQIFDLMANYIEGTQKCPPEAVLIEAAVRRRMAELGLASHTGEAGREYATKFGEKSRKFWEGTYRQDIETFRYVEEQAKKEVLRDPMRLFRCGALFVRWLLTGKLPLLRAK